MSTGMGKLLSLILAIYTVFSADILSYTAHAREC